MSAPVLNVSPCGSASFRCPGCNTLHHLNVSPGGWTWNGDKERPTLSPSVLATSGHFMEGSECGKSGHCWCNFEERTGEEPWASCYRCHSFVRDGQIEFLGDCSHALAGQTVPLPPCD